MADNATTPDKSPRKQRWIWRWLLKFSLWFLVLGVIGSLTISAVTFVAYKNRTWVMNALLKQFAAPYAVEVGPIEFSKDGKVVVKDLAVRLNEEATTDAITIEQIELTYDLDGQTLRRATFHNPVVKLSSTELEQLQSGEDQKDSTNSMQPMANLLGLLSDGIQVEGGRVEIEAFEQIPASSFDWSFNSSGFDFSKKQSTSIWANQTPAEFKLKQLQIGSGDSETTLGSLNLELNIRRDLKGVEIASLDLANLDLRLTPELLQHFTPQKPKHTEIGEKTEPVIEEETVPPLEITDMVSIRSLRLRDATVQVTGFEETHPNLALPVLPDVDVTLNADWENLHWNASGWSSDAPLTLRLEKLQVDGSIAPHDTEPLATVDAIVLTFSPQKLLAEQAVESIKIAAPKINITSESMARFPPPTKTPDSSTTPPVLPPVGQIEIVDGHLVVATDRLGQAVPHVAADFSLTQDTEKFQTLIEQVRIRPRGTTDEHEVALIRQIDIDFSLDQLLEDRQIESLRITGGAVKIGENLQKLAPPTSEIIEKEEPEIDPQKASADLFPSSPPQPSQDPAPTSLPKIETGYTISQLVVTETNVRFESLIPEIEGLSFAIETALSNVPLSKEGLLGGKKIQKIELAGIEVKDPFDGFIPVAFLPTIFVEFTWDGLAQQRIEKIDLLNPSLYIGEGLFRWVRYQRDFRPQNEGAGIEIEGAGAAMPKLGWQVQQINAHFGKLVIAPKGYPVGIVPFPFQASTNLQEGTISLKLEIPEEPYIYSFPDYEVDLYGLKGDVQFNIPVKQLDNNLTQTFSVDRAVFKNWQGENLYLTVTYDEEGVYGKFGGDAYGGYAEGQFNFYLKKEDGAWDAWLAGTSMDTEPITDLIAPDSFRMKGRINAALVSQGVGKTFGETTGTFETLEPGRIDVTKADQFIETLPKEWNQLKTSGTKVALEALKQFDYDKGQGTLYFLNRDGFLKLGLTGETGERKINFYAHDWREDKPRPAKPSPETIAKALSDLQQSE